MKRLLMVAYHFPPLAGSSGIQRTLRFVQQLPRFGWQPMVLTTHARAYEKTSDDLLPEVPHGTLVCRAFALDTARHLSIGGRYPGRLARPDRWITWRFDAVRQGLRLIREHRPDAIWSTYPIATAHRIGADLHRHSGLPWVADFRDPMAQDGYPEDPATWQMYADIERTAMRHAAGCVFTTPGAARDYRERYPDAAPRIAVIENGYDEESFTGLQAPAPTKPGSGLTLLHSGIVYPSERDPTALFEALALLRDRHGVQPGALRVRFRAAVHDDLLRALADRCRVRPFVELLPPVAYREALTEMVNADALLVLQAANCGAQIPAKLYEYLRAGRPLVGLTDPAGDTAAALRRSGVPYIAPLDDVPGIVQLLLRLLADHQAGAARLPDPAAVSAASRLARTADLAHLLDNVSDRTQRSAHPVQKVAA